MASPIMEACAQRWKIPTYCVNPMELNVMLCLGSSAKAACTMSRFSSIYVFLSTILFSLPSLYQNEAYLKRLWITNIMINNFLNNLNPRGFAPTSVVISATILKEHHIHYELDCCLKDGACLFDN
jgi:hypothetical protein